MMMQTTLKLFQIFPNEGKSFGPGTRKIAVKLPLNEKIPRKDNDLDATGFMDIMNALIPASQEQLKASLQGMKWVPLDETALKINAGEVSENGQAIPFIDLTGGGKGNRAVLKILMDLIPRQDVPADLQAFELNPNESKIMTSMAPESGLPEKLFNSQGSVEKNMAGDVLAQKLGDAVSIKEGLLPPFRAMDLRSDIGKEAGVQVDGSGATPDKTPDNGLKKDAAEIARQSVMADQTTIKEAVEKGIDQSSPRPGVQATAILKPSADQIAQMAIDAANKRNNADDELVPKATGKVNHGSKAVFHAAGLKNPVSQNAILQQTTVSQTITAQADSPSLLRQSLAKNMSENNMDLADAEKGLDESLKTENGNTTMRDTAQPEWPHARLNTSPMDRAVSESTHKTADVPLPRDMQNEVIRQIVSRMTLRNDNGQSQMNIKLKPEFLGDLRLNITTENHQVMIRMTAESSAVKDMIEQHIQVLRNELQQHGLHIDKFDVFVGTNSDAWRQRQQQASRQNQNDRGFRRAQQVVDDLLKEDMDPLTVAVPRRTNNTSLSEIDFFA
jgi:flagellar hook-length control protein FliK